MKIFTLLLLLTVQAHALTPAEQAVFVAAEYLKLNPDVAAAGADPLAHWNNNGKKECRASSFRFNVKDYLNENPDLTAAFGAPSAVSCPKAVAHFLTYGYNESRITGTSTMPAPEYMVFDPLEYKTLNADLAKLSDFDLKAHWLLYGRSECRRAVRNFSPGEYLQLNGDLLSSLGKPSATSCYKAINHFLKNGYKERRLTRNLNSIQYKVLNAPSNADQQKSGIIGALQRMGPNALKGLSLPSGYPSQLVTGMNNSGRYDLIFGPTQNDLNSAQYGFNGVQIYNEKFGVAIDSRPASAKYYHSFDGSDLYTIVVSQEPPSPWTPWTASSGAFEVKGELSLPYAGGKNGGGSQIVFNMYVYDKKSGKGFWYGANIFDTRPEFLKEYISFDGCATCTQQANSAFPLDGINTSLSLDASSMKSTSAIFKETRKVHFKITGANLVATVKKFKKSFPNLSTLSEDPSTYQVNGWNLNPEVFTPNGQGDGWIGLSFVPINIGPVP